MGAPALPAPPGLRAEIGAGVAAALVAIPSAVAYGLVVYGPLGPAASTAGAAAGLLCAAAAGIAGPLLGGTRGLVTSASAPAVAFLAAFGIEAVEAGTAPAALPALYGLVVLAAGLAQAALGLARGGRLLKLLPYPVLAGFLAGAGLLILDGQVPRLLGLPGRGALAALASPGAWRPEALAVAAAAAAAALLAPRVAPRVPPAIAGVAAGLLVHRAMGHFRPDLLRLDGNPLVVGALAPAAAPAGSLATPQGLAAVLHAPPLVPLAVSSLAVAVLASIDTLKTCVLADGATRTRHDTDRELMAQGVGNALTGVLGGVPAAGVAGPTLVNLSSGGRGRLAGTTAGLAALAAWLLLAPLLAHLPVAALAAIVCLVALRMFRLELLQLLRERSTALDFAVAAAVVVAALRFDLASAAGVGVTLAALLFLLEQSRAPVLGRRLAGLPAGSARRRVPAEAAALEARAGEIALVELTGSLFFGTADRLARELEPELRARRFLILDLSRVRSVDVSAVQALRDVAARLADRGGRLVLCDAPPGRPGRLLRSYAAQLGLDRAPLDVPLLDSAEDARRWAEERILAEALPGRGAERPLAPEAFGLLAGLPATASAAVAAVLRERDLAPGERLFAAGEAGRDLFLVRSGEVRMLVPLPEGRSHLLAVFGAGDFFGEMSFLDGAVRSADAVAGSAARLYLLGREALGEAARSHPDLEAALLGRLAAALAERLRRADTQIEALRRT